MGITNKANLQRVADLLKEEVWAKYEVALLNISHFLCVTDPLGSIQIQNFPICVFSPLIEKYAERSVRHTTQGHLQIG